MDQVNVKNKGRKEEVVMWDGENIYFEPGQSKTFTRNIAESLVNENKNLIIKEQREVVEEDVEEEDGDRYEETVNKNGQTVYRKNGQIISREEYEANVEV